MQLQCRDKTLDLSQPRIMGIVNVTPDSFSDGGNWLDPQRAIDHAHALIEAGAALIDIGGESTRPGSGPVSPDEEADRVVPVVEALRSSSAIISVDTRQPQVMAAALAAGADLINDIQALSADGAAELVARYQAGACLMHMQGEPRSMQVNPHYHDVVQDVIDYLSDRLASVCAQGLARDCVLLDPGIGFGKTVQQNLALLHRLPELVALNIPVLVGVSRKSMLGSLTGRAVHEREFAGIAAHLHALNSGARVFRVHHVAAMRDAICIWQAIEEAV